MLQPLVTGIIQNSKIKYRKCLVNYLLLHIDNVVSATEAFKDVNILMVIRRMQCTWKNILLSPIKWSSDKCGFRQTDDAVMEDEEEYA